MHNLNTLFSYPEDIRRAIYTTNAIESLNSVIRKAVKKRKLFPTDDVATKVIYLGIREASSSANTRGRRTLSASLAATTHSVRDNIIADHSFQIRVSLELYLALFYVVRGLHKRHYRRSRNFSHKKQLQYRAADMPAE